MCAPLPGRRGRPITENSASLQNIIEGAQGFASPPPEQREIRTLVKSALHSRAVYTQAIIGGQDIRPRR